MEYEELDGLLVKAADKIIVESEIEIDFNKGINLIEEVDSFDIVTMLLDIEMKLEDLRGEYISLADENLFDSNKSPLIKWDNWVNYVYKKINA